MASLANNPVARWMKSVTSEIAGQILHLATSALGLVAALAWNDAVQAVFKEYFPAGSGITAKFVYALIVSTLVVAVTINLARLAALTKKGREALRGEH
jgi:hypothetical protein